MIRRRTRRRRWQCRWRWWFRKRRWTGRCIQSIETEAAVRTIFTKRTSRPCSPRSAIIAKSIVRPIIAERGTVVLAGCGAPVVTVGKICSEQAVTVLGARSPVVAEAIIKVRAADATVC